MNDSRNDHPDAPPAAAHPAVRTLERLAFEPTTAAADDAAMENARAHLAACPTCAAEIVSLRAASRRFLAGRPTEAFVEAVERRAATDAGPAKASRETRGLRAAPRPRWWFAGGGIAALGTAALAAVLIAGSLSRSPRPPSSNRVAAKGGAVDLRVFVSRRGEDAQPLDPTSALHPGEVLRFEAAVPADGYLAILDLDGRGRIQRYHPSAPGAQSAPVLRGRAILPESIHLDDFVGEELIALVFAAGAPLDLDGAQRALADAYRAAGGVLSRIGDVSLEGASIALVRVRKERAPR